ncbi:MAG: hypothetical protein BRC29_04030 [Nanohaloarchaea archaeon SW_7_43_1]|nr:MAG: hypothetical protein BRC29_04030 [Nanohaloarchaea archaeon SW_7_43_1]
MKVSYDDEADVLSIRLKECDSKDTVHRNDGILVSKDKETGEVVGYTIMYFGEKDGISLPLDENEDGVAPT